MINKDTMTKLVEIKNFPNKNIQTSEKGTNNNPIELSKASKVEESSNKQDSQEKRMPYRHPNHKNHYDQRPCQEEYKQYSSYRETNYNIKKEQKQN